MISIIDYGMGNLRSVYNAFAHLGIDACITDNEMEILKADKVVLPGVGSFHQAMENIRLRHLEDTLKRVFDHEKPILGICLGMQLLVDWGLEEGMTKGLGFIPGHVEKLQNHPSYKIPHIGFNRVFFDSTNKGARLFNGIESGDNFYFVHSYQVLCDDPAHVIAYTKHGETFVSAIARDHVYGLQFHPEKSRETGLKVLKNFASL